jgi:hypothetical protein
MSLTKFLFTFFVFCFSCNVYAYDGAVVKYCAMLRDDEAVIYKLQWTIDTRVKLMNVIKNKSKVQSQKEIDKVQKMIDDAYDAEVEKAWKIDAELNKDPNWKFHNAAADHALLTRSAMINVLNDGGTLIHARDAIYYDCLSKIVPNPK